MSSLLAVTFIDGTAPFNGEEIPTSQLFPGEGKTWTMHQKFQLFCLLPSLSQNTDRTRHTLTTWGRVDEDGRLDTTVTAPPTGSVKDTEEILQLLTFP